MSKLGKPYGTCVFCGAKLVDHKCGSRCPLSVRPDVPVLADIHTPFLIPVDMIEMAEKVFG